MIKITSIFILAFVLVPHPASASEAGVTQANPQLSDKPPTTADSSQKAKGSILTTLASTVTGVGVGFVAGIPVALTFFRAPAGGRPSMQQRTLFIGSIIGCSLLGGILGNAIASKFD